ANRLEIEVCFDPLRTLGGDSILQADLFRYGASTGSDGSEIYAPFRRTQVLDPSRAVPARHDVQVRPVNQGQGADVTEIEFLLVRVRGNRRVVAVSSAPPSGPDREQWCLLNEGQVSVTRIPRAAVGRLGAIGTNPAGR